MATSTSSHSLVNTDSTFPPASTRSAGSSPRATAIQCASMTVKDSASAAGGQRRADEDQDEAEAHAGREALVQDQDSGHRRHRRVDVRDHRCSTGPTSAMSAKKIKNASAVHTNASTPTEASTPADGTACGHCRAATGAYATAQTASDAAITPTDGRPDRWRARIAGPTA